MNDDQLRFKYEEKMVKFCLIKDILIDFAKKENFIYINPEDEHVLLGHCIDPIPYKKKLKNKCFTYINSNVKDWKKV